MKPNDFKIFCDEWCLAQELGVNGKVLSDQAMRRVFEALMDYPLPAVCRAIKKHNESNRYAPVLADITGILDAGKPKHLGANEAWALALRSMDEAETVVLTDEILKARALAWEVWASGDEVGARMAFREAYERETANAGKPVWKVSLGFDTGRRDGAVRLAVEQGLLPKSELVKLGVDVARGEAITPGKLIDMAAHRMKSEIGNPLVFVRDRIENLPDLAEEERLEREIKRQEFENHRRDQIAKVNAVLKNKIYRNWRKGRFWAVKKS